MGKTCSKLSSHMQRTSFSTRDIREWEKIVLREYPSGQIPENAFLKYVRLFKAHRKDGGKFAAIVFRVFDENKDGYIDFKDFICALSATSQGNLDDKLDILFSLLDSNNDQYITREKLTNFLDSIKQILDAGETSSLESLDDNIVSEWTETIFDEWDTFHEGKLGINEFREGCKSNELIVKALSMG